MICRDLRTFRRLWAKKVLFWGKTVFFGQKVPYYMVDHVMSPDPSDQLSEWSHLSTTALQCF